jgi:hypothetical protein
LSVNIILTLHKAIVSSIKAYARPAWMFAAHTYHLILQHLWNEVLRATGNFLRHTSIRELHVAFNIPYVCDFITILCRQQAAVIQSHDNENVRNIGQGEAIRRKC